MAVLLLRAAAGGDRRRRGIEVDADDDFVLHADAEIRRLGDAEFRQADRKARVEPVAVALGLDVSGAGHLLASAVQNRHRPKGSPAGRLRDSDVWKGAPAGPG